MNVLYGLTLLQMLRSKLQLNFVTEQVKLRPTSTQAKSTVDKNILQVNNLRLLTGTNITFFIIDKCT